MNINHYNRISLLIILFLLLPYSKLSGNILTINGTVTDSISGNHLVGANVYLEDTGFGTSTDEKGIYKLTNINKGRYMITVSYLSLIHI